MKISFAFITTILLFGCIKQPDPPLALGKYENGLLILCEGLFNSNNASLSFYSFDENTVYNHVFQAENGRGLGDTANDLVWYEKDGKDFIIICVDISSQIEILEANTLKSLAQIPMFDGTNAREPRRVAVNEDATKAYVANFDGTVAVLDLDTYEVLKLIEVGANPDGISIYEDEVFVTNSGGLNFPAYDSTISVINNVNDVVVEEFLCPINPNEIIANEANYLYVRANGNYDDVLPSLTKINALTGEAVFNWAVNYSSFQPIDEFLYFYNAEFERIQRFNMITDNIDPNFEVIPLNVETFGGFFYHFETGKTYIIDKKGYTSLSEIHIYNSAGIFENSFTVGLNANSILKI